MDMLKTAVRKIVKEMLTKSYPHTQQPPSMYAMVLEVKTSGAFNEAVIRILDKTKSRDEKYPDIPGVKTDFELKRGDMVVILMLYGERIPYIVGRCV